MILLDVGLQKPAAGDPACPSSAPDGRAPPGAGVLRLQQLARTPDAGVHVHIAEPTALRPALATLATLLPSPPA